VPAQPVDATPSDRDFFSKGSVHETRETMEVSSAQRADMWNRWKAGESLHEIGRALGKDHVVVHLLLKRHGGIAPPAGM